MQLSKNILTIR